MNKSSLWKSILVFLLISRPVLSQEFRLKLVPVKGKISGIKWDEGRDTQEPVLQISKSGKYFVVLHGRYRKNLGEILYENRPISRKQDGSFDIRVFLGSEKSEFSIREVNPSGSTSIETYKLLLPNKKSWKSSKNWAITPGIGVTLITYEQPTVSLSELLLTVKLLGSYSLTEKWSIAGSGFYNILPLQSTSVTQKIQFIGSNVRVGYKITFPSTDFKVFLMAGWYYNTSISTPSNFGYKDMYGPQIFPVFQKAVFGQPLSIYFKYSPIMNGSSFLGLSSAEMATGLSYEIYRGIGVTLDLAHFTLLLTSGGMAQSNSYTLGTAYVF